jgi:hypothetical protein
LVPIKTSILKNTIVSEASNPYAEYYGQLPRKAEPNSIFLHIKKFYYLEEILSYTQGLEKCLRDTLNIASAYIEINNKQYPAIRIKRFTDYSQIEKLQTCLARQGVEFSDKFEFNGEVDVRINKIFHLEDFGNTLFIDLTEDHKGYITHETPLTSEEFEEKITAVKNNHVCKLFDAVRGELLINGKVVELVRVYSEALDLKLLECIKKGFK